MEGTTEEVQATRKVIINRQNKLIEVELSSPFVREVKSIEMPLGFDTETLKTGYAFLLCDSEGNHSWIHKLEDLFPFILSGKNYVCYNLGYDASVILKWFGRKFCNKLFVEKRTSYGDIRVWYIPHKFLYFTKGNVWTRFWDIAQYFAVQGKHTPLAVAAKYVGMKKTEFPVADMDESFYGNEELLDYCDNDAKITGKLGELVIKTIEDTGIVVTTLASPASIIESYIVDQRLVHLSNLTRIPQGALQYAESSVQTPWREFFKRGYFSKMYDYDINSAFPWVIGRLKDLRYGSWRFVKGAPPKGAVYGYLKALVSVPDDAYVSWINFRSEVANFSPTGKFYTYLTLNGYNHCSAEAIDGWYFFTSAIRLPFKRVVDELYKIKQSSRGYKRHMVKVMMASVYGKFHQVREDEAGRMYNPFYTAEITTDTRLKVYELAKQEPTSLIGIHTDCVYSMKKLGIEDSVELGSWGLRGTSSMLVVGLNHFEKGYGYWHGAFETQPNQAIYGTEFDGKYGPMSMAEALKRDFDNANVFLPIEEKINIIHQIHKRRWLDLPKCGGDLLNNIYDSRPFPIHVLGGMHEEALWTL